MSLTELLRRNELEWAITSFGAPEQALQGLLTLLNEANGWGREHLHGEAPEFSERNLAAAFEKSPAKVRAFLQALISTRSPQMLVMTWRILQGKSIAEVDVHYREQREFRMRVLLRGPNSDHQPEAYESSDVDDVAMLRHFGISKINEAPVLDGFYPLRL